MSIDSNRYPLLALINTPEDLRLLHKERLPHLCTELRHYLLEAISRTSGHFASGLGTIELTIALHYVYNTPFDNLIWDVGHQAYPHKILTGRRQQITTIRQRHGLHPFPCRSESEYDVLTVGHSSTSISAGLGMALAAERENLGRRTIAVIGDGAMTAGIAFEAMNHTGASKADLLVVLNDNEMSISENVGALSNHLAQILSGHFYTSLREEGKRVLSGFPPIKDLLKKTEEYLKGMVVPGTLFEELGFNYIGPVDGHDVIALTQLLKNMRGLHGPQLLHVITTKGKGYIPAENDPINFHAVPKFDPGEGALPKSGASKPTYSQIFGGWLCTMAALDPKLMAITPAMREGSGMVRFSQEFPQHYFDVAIAEQHAVTLAAGLAIGGYKPVVAIYSTFLQRAYDQLIHDVAIPSLPVLFAIDRAGIVGGDGATHQGAFDLAFLRPIPNMVIMAPSDENECQQMLYTGFHYQQGPVAVRYPRGSGPGVPLQPLQLLPIGKGCYRRQGEGLALLNFGALLPEVLIAAQQFNATVVDMRFVKPLDQQLLAELMISHTAWVTLEDGSIIGGAGSGVNEWLMQQGLSIPVLNIGLPDHFIPHGEPEALRRELGLDAEGIIQQIHQWKALLQEKLLQEK